MASLKKMDHKKKSSSRMALESLSHWLRVAGSLAESYRGEHQHSKGPMLWEMHPWWIGLGRQEGLAPKAPGSTWEVGILQPESSVRCRALWQSHMVFYSGCSTL